MLNNLINKKIAVWGLGKEGQSLLRFFEKKNISVDSIDGDDVDLNLYDIVFKSPGISLYHPAIKNAPNTIISSSSNLALSLIKKDVFKIGITGTKGKSTTSSLMAHLLKKLGKKVALGGNIGVPLIDLVDDNFDFLVVEQSSYQAADILYPYDITILTNLYPEHLDWHGSHEQYYTDKLNLIKIRKPNQIAVLNAINENTIQRTKDFQNLLWFNQKDGFYVLGHSVYFQDIEVLKSSDIPQLIGTHNLENICAVLTALRAMGIAVENLAEILSDFNPLPHRLAQHKIGDYLCIDDSISTTPETAIAALKVFEGKKRFLLVGGYERGQDYSDLISYARQEKNVILICMPDTGKRVFENSSDLNSVFVDTMEQAVLKVKEQAHPSDVIILSPAAPSYNLYKHFDERGDDFIECCKKILLK